MRLSADRDFLESFHTGLSLLFLAWGWNLEATAPIANAAKNRGQAWQKYPVRLFKVARFLILNTVRC